MPIKSPPRAVLGAAVIATCALAVPIAHADDAVVATAPSRHLATGLRLGLRLEPGVAVAVTDPQAEMTSAGFGQTVKVMVGVGRYLELGPSATFTTLPAVPAMTDAGTSWAFGGGGRLMRPHDAAPGGGALRAISPWIDADLLYVRTGDLSRPGFATGVGASMPLDRDRAYWLGPYLRYSHILDGARAGFDDRDAKILTFGLSLEVGRGLAKSRAPMVAEVEDPPPPEPVAVVVPADRDGDGVVDGDDDCPDVAGVADYRGCPPPAVAPAPPQLELTQHIAFAWNSSELTADSHAGLDEVVVALRDRTDLVVQVDGHASSDGGEVYNQALSEARAAAVVDYLVAHGIARDRLAAKGFSSSVPSESNATSGGRVANRRVEFVIAVAAAPKGNTP